MELTNLITIHSTEEFDKEIKNSDAVFVDFYAERCGPCKMFAPIVDQFAEKHADWKVLKIDVDENEELARRYEVFSIPTQIIFVKGEIKFQDVGVRSLEDLEDIIKGEEGDI